MNNEHKIAPVMLVLCLILGVTSCSREGVKTKELVAAPVPDVIAQNKGNVIVALFGIPGCPGTDQAIPFLEEYSKTKPKGVVVCRVDVPFPGEKLDKARNISPNINYALDNDRAIAGRLEFFFYPTLYILDKDGIVRFAGGCEPDRVRTMVSEILSEGPSVEKKMYTPQLVNVGEIIPDIKMPDMEGKETSLSSLCSNYGSVLFFSSTACVFSVSALNDLEKLKKDFADKKFSRVIVSFGQGVNEVKGFYSEKSPGSIVVIDADKSVSTKYFGVPAVPFLYILDKDRKVLDRRPFAYDVAKTAISKAYGTDGCG
ncbi:MAG: redoxin domain-containing protein, partial [Kiritimatiellae bacterium]|nr:redoxin domain-containing protein [Kiritimatiellia bacterium]